MSDLSERYRAYLAALNERRLDDLVEYVQDELTYNGAALTRPEYQAMLAGDVEAIPDLFFDARIIVATEDRIACRILFDCKPEKEFLGFTPDGGRFLFAEHVFYRFVGGRIAAVDSLIDRHAIAEQLQARRS
ncbi:ester cyclase [Actinoplanes sp. NPDC049265]|uniref:ester cyclase n=1 Tax=Actinoplanes sp. NPDC049265 TaxID=3363902 RepID=UPI0037122465